MPIQGRLRTTPLEISARPLEPGDRAVCEKFDCGSEPWQEEVNRFVREIYWRGNRPPTEQTILSFTDARELHGFGTWKIRPDLKRLGQEPLTVIDIPYFGVQRQFHGARDSEGRSVAGRLYATIEAVARMHPLATPDMLVHLVCDVRNETGFRFWQRQGFRMAEQLDFGRVSYWRMFRYP